MPTEIGKFNKKYTEVVKTIEKNFADLKAGEKMLISSPRSIANYVAKIPYGTEKSVKLRRRELAENADAHNTCPLTCGIFLRIAIEASIEQSDGAKPDLPFWRVINRNSSLIKKLPISQKYLTELRNSEGLQ